MTCTLVKIRKYQDKRHEIFCDRYIFFSEFCGVQQNFLHTLGLLLSFMVYIFWSVLLSLLQIFLGSLSLTKYGKSAKCSLPNDSDDKYSQMKRDTSYDGSKLAGFTPVAPKKWPSSNKNLITKEQTTIL